MLKKISFDKVNGTKNAFFFLLRTPTHNSFTLNLWLLYELKYKVHLSKTVCGIFNFLFRLVFIKVTKYMDSLTLKRHNSFQN